MKLHAIACLLLWPVLAIAAPRDAVKLDSFEVSGREVSATLKSRLRASLLSGLTQAGYEVVESAARNPKLLRVKVELVGTSDFAISVELRDPSGNTSLARVTDSCQVCTVTEACDAVLGTPALLRMKRAQPASADGTARAKELYKRGEAAFQVGNFAEAAERFQESFSESPQPKLLWNIAQALRRQYEIDHDLTKLRRASAVLRNFRSAGGDDEETINVARDIDEAIARAEAEQKKARAPEPVIAPVVTPAPDAVVSSKPVETPRKPLYKRWELWAGVSAAAGAAIIIGLAVGLSQSTHENFWNSAQMGCVVPCSLVDLR